MAVVWNNDNAAHLLRRAAFGDSPENLTKFLRRNATMAEAVDTLLGFRPSKKKPPAKNEVDEYNVRKMQRWWLKQMIRKRKPADGCREKLVLFLHGLLVSGLAAQPTLKYTSYQNRLFRMYAKGNYRDLIREFNRDPANLHFLDGIHNVASSDGVHVNANENFGRELMELFTLGVFQLGPGGMPDPSRPNYSEDDVHQLSRACTGWTTIDRDQGVWNPWHWDGGHYDDDGDGLPDPMTLFGRTSNNLRIDEGVAGSEDDVLELIFSRTDDAGNNQVGMFLSSKLWSFYAYDAPADGLGDLLAEFAAIFADNNFELAPLLRAMWTHDEFYSDRAKGRSVKSPVEYAVGSFRAFNIKSSARWMAESDEELGERLGGMGMELFHPPNVAGWPGGLSWMNSGTLLKRMEFAKDLSISDWGSSRLRLRRLKDLPIRDDAADPSVVVNAIVRRAGLDSGPLALSGSQIDALMAFVTDNGAKQTLDLSDEWTDDAQHKVRGLIALVLQAAEAQLQ